jgi:hypothetical protein
VRRAALVAAAVAALAIGGCGGCGGTHHKAATAPSDRALADEATVRLWAGAVYDGHFARAASFFAPGAIVQQFGTRTLRSRRQALAFNRGLTCRPTVRAIRHEGTGTLLVTFNLGPGPRGGCTSGGTVRVRFFLRRGLIEGWHQLPDPPGSFSLRD